MATVRENVKKSVRTLVDIVGSNKEFAEKIGVSKQAVSNWTRGSQAPDIEIIAQIAKTYGVRLSDILDGTIDKNAINHSAEYDHEACQGFSEVPIYGSIAAGTPIEMIPVDDFHQIPSEMHSRYPNAFLLRVSGESMNHILPNGSYALIDPREEVVKDNDPYAVCINGYDATIKRVKKLENGFQLVPDSTDPTFPVQTFNYNEPGTDEITVIGKVVWHVIPFDWAY